MVISGLVSDPIFNTGFCTGNITLLAILSLENQQSHFHSFLSLHILQKGLFALWAHGPCDAVPEQCWR